MPEPTRLTLPLEGTNPVMEQFCYEVDSDHSYAKAMINSQQYSQY